MHLRSQHNVEIFTFKVFSTLCFLLQKEIEVIYCLGEILLIDIDQKSNKKSTCYKNVFTFFRVLRCFHFHTLLTHVNQANLTFRWINTWQINHSCYLLLLFVFLVVAGVVFVSSLYSTTSKIHQPKKLGFLKFFVEFSLVWCMFNVYWCVCA